MPERTSADKERGKNIRRARVAKQLTQVEMARILEVKQATVSQWEGGKPPDLKNRLKLSALLGIPWQKLLTEVTEVPAGALENPQVRQLVDNYLNLDPEARQLIDALVQLARQRSLKS